MLLSLAFTVLDILAVTDALKGRLPSGIDPFWELAFVFKLLTDTVVLDDFKTALGSSARGEDAAVIAADAR